MTEEQPQETKVTEQKEREELVLIVAMPFAATALVQLSEIHWAKLAQHSHFQEDVLPVD